MNIPPHMGLLFKYGDELEELLKVVVSADRLFSKMKIPFYNWKNEWKFVGEDIDAIIIHHQDGRAPSSPFRDPLSVHFKGIFHTALADQSFPNCAPVLKQMRETLQTLQKIHVLQPFEEVPKKAIWSLAIQTHCVLYDQKHPPPPNELEGMAVLDKDTTLRMNRKHNRHLPFDAALWKNFTDNADNRTSILCRLAPIIGLKEKSFGFAVMRNEGRGRMNPEAPEGWNLLGYGADSNAPGAAELMIQNILGTLRSSTRKDLHWCLDLVH